MAETENKYVNPITKEDKQKIVDSSVQNLTARPTSNATDMKKIFVRPIVNEDGPPYHSIADEVDRVANEADDAISKLYKEVEDIPLIVSTAVQFKYTFFQMLKMFAGLWDESVDGAFDSKELRLTFGVFNRQPSVGDEFWIDFETVDGYKVKILACVTGFRVGGIDWSFAGSIDAIDLNAYAQNNGENVWNDKLIIIRNGKTQQGISDAIAELQEKQSQFAIYKVVDKLPVGAPDDVNKIYLVPATTQEEDNVLEEWLYIVGKGWELVGTQKAKISGLIPSSEKGAPNGVASLDENGKVPKEQLPDDIGGIDDEALKDYVKFTDYAKENTAGVVKVAAHRGMAINVGSGLIELKPASETELRNRAWYMPVTGGNLDTAVKVGITTNTETWTDEDKAAACETIGAVRLYKHVIYHEEDGGYPTNETIAISLSNTPYTSHSQIATDYLNGTILTLITSGCKVCGMSGTSAYFVDNTGFAELNFFLVPIVNDTITAL